MPNKIINKKIINKSPKTTLLKLILVIGVGAGVFGGTANADTENEHALLAQIVQKINALTPLINQAQEAADPHQRVIFNYTALRADLQKIKDGLNQPLSTTPLEPRVVTPIVGDYLTLRAKGGQS